MIRVLAQVSGSKANEIGVMAYEALRIEFVVAVKHIETIREGDSYTFVESEENPFPSLELFCLARGCLNGVIRAFDMLHNKQEDDLPPSRRSCRVRFRRDDKGHVEEDVFVV